LAAHRRLVEIHPINDGNGRVARRWSRRLPSDFCAVVAHATTNAMLAGYVLLWGKRSFC